MEFDTRLAQITSIACSVQFEADSSTFADQPTFPPWALPSGWTVYYNLRGPGRAKLDKGLANRSKTLSRLSRPSPGRGQAEMLLYREGCQPVGLLGRRSDIIPYTRTFRSRSRP